MVDLIEETFLIYFKFTNGFILFETIFLALAGLNILYLHTENAES